MDLVISLARTLPPLGGFGANGQRAFAHPYSIRSRFAVRFGAVVVGTARRGGVEVVSGVVAVALLSAGGLSGEQRRYENGSDFRMSTFLKVLKALEVSPEEFFSGIK